MQKCKCGNNTKDKESVCVICRLKEVKCPPATKAEIKRMVEKLLEVKKNINKHIVSSCNEKKIPTVKPWIRTPSVRGRLVKVCIDCGKEYESTANGQKRCLICKKEKHSRLCREGRSRRKEVR